jgi:hypothetical protein
MNWLQTLRRDGCLPLKTVGFFTGLALTVIACLTFAAKLLDLNPIASINQVWFCVCVCVCVCVCMNECSGRREGSDDEDYL